MWAIPNRCISILAVIGTEVGVCSIGFSAVWNSIRGGVGLPFSKVLNAV
jgi:hypothetical protein